MEERSDDFYIIEELCLTCRTPEAVAPTLVGFHDDPDAGKSHCYLRKQPTTAEEVELAIKAVESCCCGAYGYRGFNPEVRRKLGL
jgi:hypothetical protein